MVRSSPPFTTPMVNIAIAVVLLFAAAFVLYGFSTNNRPEQGAGAGTSVNVSPSPFGITETPVEERLIRLGLEAAQRMGLQGQPVAYRAVRLKLWEWWAIDGSPPRLGDPDLPVLYFAAIGQMKCLPGPSLPPPTGSPEYLRYLTPPVYEAVYVILDLARQAPREARCVYTASMLKIPVALNRMTPLPPLLVPATLPPVTPPTPAPTASAIRTSVPSPAPSLSPTPVRRTPYP